MLQSRVDQLLDRMRLEFQLDFAGVQPRHFSRFAHQPVQAIGFFVDDRQKFVLLLFHQAPDSKANLSRKP